MIIKSGNMVLLVGQKKSDPEVKTVYRHKGNGWSMVYAGPFDGLKKAIDHQKKLAEKRELRRIVADLCGVSCRATCEDMGISQI